jgi:hypothetical protein
MAIVRRPVPLALAVLILAGAHPALAQKVTTVEELTLQQTFVQMTNALSNRPTGEALGVATAVEIATQPFGTSTTGFNFKLDPSTGLLARTSTTFGPSFAESAITVGEGKVVAGATFSATNYDKVSGLDLEHLPIGARTSSTASLARTGTGNFSLSSQTLAIAGAVGVSANLDVGVVVPLVTIKFDGVSTLIDGNGVVTRLAETTGKFAGIGDMAAVAKYRFFKFKGPEMTDPGGVALLVNMRLPTGSRDNLRGLGVTRTFVGGVVSFGKGRLKPHANGGFEYWNKKVGIPVTATSSESVRHQIKYAAGVELEANPKVTLMFDFLGQHIRDGGELGYISDTFNPNPVGVSAAQALVGTADGIRKALLVPGLKVNLKAKLLLTLNAIITVENNGLHSKVTPVVGLSLTK